MTKSYTVAFTAKVLTQVLRAWHAQAKTTSGSQSVQEGAYEAVEAGLVKGWLKGLTLGCDATQGAVATVLISSDIETQVLDFCRSWQSKGQAEGVLMCEVRRTHLGPQADFRWKCSFDSPEVLVRTGYPIVVAEVLANAYAVRPVDLLAAVGVPLRTAARRVTDDKQLKSDESDRLFRAGDVMFHALDVFGDLELARQFLNTPNPSLGGVTPFSLLDTVPGRDRVVNLLGQIEHGVYA